MVGTPKVGGRVSGRAGRRLLMLFWGTGGPEDRMAKGVLRFKI